jgi:hypothetical protein
MNLNFNPHALNPNVEGLNLKRKKKKNSGQLTKLATNVMILK